MCVCVCVCACACCEDQDACEGTAGALDCMMTFSLPSCIHRVKRKWSFLFGSVEGSVFQLSYLPMALPLAPWPLQSSHAHSQSDVIQNVHSALWSLYTCVAECMYKVLSSSGCLTCYTFDPHVLHQLVWNVHMLRTWVCWWKDQRSASYSSFTRTAAHSLADDMRKDTMDSMDCTCVKKKYVLQDFKGDHCSVLACRLLKYWSCFTYFF